MASLYNEAGDILSEILHNKRGLKDALYDTSVKRRTDLRPLKALICKTLDNKGALQKTLENVLGKEVYEENGTVGLCMAYDLLISDSKKISGGGPIKKLLLDNQEKLEKVLRKQLKQCPTKKNTTILPAGSYYLRLNIMKLSTNKNPIPKLKHLTYEQDPLIPDCIKVSDAEWIKDIEPLVTKGLVAVHDRSSQLAAHAAFFNNNSHASSSTSTPLPRKITLMEVCAAPGSKTAHLIAMALSSLKNDSKDAKKPVVEKIVAVEKAPKRCRILLQRLEEMCGPLYSLPPPEKSETADERRIFSVDAIFPETSDLKNKRVRVYAGNLEIIVRCEDFLETRCHDYEEAHIITLDPSCSGSGLVQHGEDKTKTNRLDDLAALQKKMIFHAMSFNAHTICYSTCSVHKIENEDVVEQCLKKNTEWTAEYPLPFTWDDPESYDGLAAKCVHCKPDVHKCRGFFLSKICRAPQEMVFKCAKDSKKRTGKSKKEKKKENNEQKDAENTMKENIEAESKEKDVPEEKIVEGEELPPWILKLRNRKRVRAEKRERASEAKKQKIETNLPKENINTSKKKKKGKAKGIQIVLK